MLINKIEYKFVKKNIFIPIQSFPLYICKDFLKIYVYNLIPLPIQVVLFDIKFSKIAKVTVLVNKNYVKSFTTIQFLYYVSKTFGLYILFRFSYFKDSIFLNNTFRNTIK